MCVGNAILNYFHVHKDLYLYLQAAAVPVQSLSSKQISNIIFAPTSARTVGSLLQ